MSTRGAGLGLLVVGVVLAHGLAASWFVEQAVRLAEGSGPAIQRIDVAFVRELQAAEPLAPALPLPRAAAPKAVVAAAPAASAASAAKPAVPPPSAASAPPPEPAPAAADPVVAQASAPPPASPPVPPPAPTVPESPPPAPLPASTTATAAASPAPTASAAAATRFEWPPSTRLSYTLVGDYRGPVHGNARVEWLRRGDQYQVHLEVNMGAVVSRRMSSEGRLTEQGLAPQRYEEVTTALFRDTRRQVVRFEGDRVVLATGVAQPALPQVQDTASQFVQLTWLFTTNADRLRVGQSVEVPLALPRRMDRWVYDVRTEEEVETPAGRIRAFHMVPRRVAVPQGELLVESWFAPSLQYLPVRIVIRQGDQAWVDLTLSRLPQQGDAVPPTPR